MKIRPVVAELFRADERKDSHDEAIFNIHGSMHRCMTQDK
jgi:hypothetical protein